MNAGSMRMPSLPKSRSRAFRHLESELEEARQLYDNYEKSISTLETDSNNVDANTDAGLFVCLVDGRWDQGLHWLTRSSREELQVAANLELIPGEKTVEQRVEIAQAWHQIGQSSQAKLHRRKYLEHAQDWYLAAQEKSAGLVKVKIERHLKEIASNLRVLNPTATSDVKPVITNGPKEAELLNRNNYSSSLPTDYARVRDNIVEIGMGSSISGEGEAAGGLEFQGVRHIKVVGAASSGVRTKIDSYTKTGFYIDYHTQKGYTKRVFLCCGSTAGMSFSDGPPWGAQGSPASIIDVNRRSTYLFDLRRWAPDDWDGTCWFTVYMQNTGTDGKLLATIEWKGS